MAANCEVVRSGRDHDMPATITEFAPAKVNLTLEVLGRRPDGYHELASLVAFALDVGDSLTLSPGDNLVLAADGPEAAAIAGPNLITDAARRIAAARPGVTLGRFHLVKRLPVASGIGGGSADAAAAMRAIARANDITDPFTTFSGLAAALGADIPVCIGRHGGPPSAAFMTGIGDQVWRPAGRSLLPPDGIAALLVNPRVPLSTASVFHALAAPPLQAAGPVQPPAPFSSLDNCLGYMAAHGNDLEEPAVRLSPAIAEVLHALRHLPGCRLARMSGSGATCFALFDDLDQAQNATQHLHSSNPLWWVRPTRLA